MLDRYDACSSLELANIHQNGTETAAPGVLIDYQWKIATVLGPPAITPCPMSPLPLQRGAILWGGPAPTVISAAPNPVAEVVGGQTGRAPPSRTCHRSQQYA